MLEATCSWALNTKLGMTSVSNPSAHVYLKHRNKALKESGHRDKAENIVGQCLTCGQELSSGSNCLLWDLMNQEHGVSWDWQEAQSDLKRIHQGKAGIGGRGMEFHLCADSPVSTEELHLSPPSTPLPATVAGTLGPWCGQVPRAQMPGHGAGWRSTGSQGQWGGIPPDSLSFAERGEL